MESYLEELNSLLFQNVVSRFTRVGQLSVRVKLLEGGESGSTLEPIAPFEFDTLHEERSCCREHAHLRISDSVRIGRATWSLCQCGCRCGYVPVVHDGRCLAALTLTAPRDMPETNFRGQVKILEVLVAKFVDDNADSLNRIIARENSSPSPADLATETIDSAVVASRCHPRVAKAIEHIRHNLSDPKLSVANIAGTLRINAHYLGSLFVEQVGERMSRFIVRQRVEMAKKLLVTTDWQIKRIAAETGFATAARFCHVFGKYAGTTPRTYRRHHGARGKQLTAG